MDILGFFEEIKNVIVDHNRDGLKEFSYRRNPAEYENIMVLRFTLNGKPYRLEVSLDEQKLQ